MHIEWVTCKCAKAPLMLHGNIGCHPGDVFFRDDIVYL